MSGESEPATLRLRVRHVPVLLDAVLELLQPQPGQTVVDATVGAGGHAAAIARCLGPNGCLIGIDRDADMLRLARQRPWPGRTHWVQGNFAALRQLLDQLAVERVDAVLMDLGVASDQLDDPQRGLSFSLSGPLDMRLDRASGQPASRLVNRLSAETLAEIFFRYGQERHSRRVARAVVKARQRRPIQTTAELAEVVRRAVPAGRHRIDPATRVFQALRIAVNDELGSLAGGLQALPQCVRAGGRAAVISFHSLEDRLVKQALRRPVWEPLTPKPVRPTSDEVATNRRARSAKLRAARLLVEQHDQSS